MQLLIRNSKQNLLLDKMVGVQFSILKGTANGPVVYREAQLVRTNSQGMANLVIGNGTLSLGKFDSIDWGRETYFIKTEIDPAGAANYTISSSNIIYQVPYAMYAGNGLPAGAKQGNVLSFCNGMASWEPCTPKLPSLLTLQLTNITAYGVSSGGSLMETGGAEIIARGICYGKNTNPTLADSVQLAPNGGNIFYNALSNLDTNTTYYVRAFATNSVGTAYGNQFTFKTLSVVSDTSLKIGMSYQGGVIAYLFKEGDPGYNSQIRHGIIAQTSDLHVAAKTNFKWNIFLDSFTYANQISIGGALANTLQIIAKQPVDSAADYAARLCNLDSTGGFKDWFLPTRNELQLMFVGKNKINGFSTEAYWSSSEAGYYTAYGLDFRTGNCDVYFKKSNLKIRAIRYF